MTDSILRTELSKYKARIAELDAENIRLDAEWKKTHEWNNELVKEHYQLKSDLAAKDKHIADLEDSKKKMAWAMTEFKQLCDKLKLDIESADAEKLDYFGQVLKLTQDLAAARDCIDELKLKNTEMRMKRAELVSDLYAFTEKWPMHKPDIYQMLEATAPNKENA